MTSVPAPETYPCPYCLAQASAATGCPSCGRGPDTDAITVTRMDGEIADLTGRLTAARAEIAALETRLNESITSRNTIATKVRIAAERARAFPLPPTVPPPLTAPSPPAARSGTAPETGPIARMPPAPPAPGAEPETGRPRALGATPSPADGVEQRITALTAQNVLFALGGLLLVVAAAVFTAVAWAQVGVIGRAAILAAATGTVLLVPPFAVRRGLHGAAETLAAVGLLMVLLDGYAAWAVDLLGVQGLGGPGYSATVCAVTAGIARGYGRLAGQAGHRDGSAGHRDGLAGHRDGPAGHEGGLAGHRDGPAGGGLAGPGIAAVLVAQPVLPLLAVAGDAGATGWSVALSGVAVLDAVVVRLRREWAEPSGPGLVAYLCGLLAVSGAGMMALADLAVVESATEAARSGGALVLAAAVATGAAVLSGYRTAQAWTAGLLTAAVGIAGGGWALQLDAGKPLTRLAMVALAVAVAVVAVRTRLPGIVGRGTWIGALAVAAPPAVGVAWAAVVAGTHSVATARPALSAAWTTTVSGFEWDILLALVGVLCAYVISLPDRARTDLGLTALLMAALLTPAALRLPWWTAALLGMLVAASAIALATRATDDLRLLFRLAVSVTATAHALLVAFGDAAVAAGVCGSIVAIGAVTGFGLRADARHGDVTGPARQRGVVGAGAVTAGLLAIAPTVWLALLALDVPVTLRVRAILLVGILLCAAARHPSVSTPQVTGVALLVAAATPLWAIPGTDPGALYVGAGLLLVASLATARLPKHAATRLPEHAATRLPVFAAAGVLAVGLAAWTGEDLAKVLVRPYGALAFAWAGGHPSSSPIAWATVAAVLMSAAAAGRFAWSLSATRTAAAMAVAPLLGLAIPLGVAAARAPWPAVPLTSLTVGLAGMVVLTLGTSRPDRRAGLTAAFGVLAGAGLCGATPVAGAMLAAFALVVVAGAVAGVAARTEIARIAGWVTGTLALIVVAVTAAHVAELRTGGSALAVLAAAAVAAALEWMLAAKRPREARPVAAVAQAAAVIALMTAGTLGRAALIATLWSVVLAVRALRPHETHTVRNAYALAAAGGALLGWWLLLSARQVGVAEAYTAPAAAAALAGGWFARRQRPVLPSWTAYGPALAAAFLPTLAVIAGSGPDHPEYARRLLLGADALAVLIAGATARLRAPVVSGALALTLIALHELAQIWDLVPRWAPLALGGLLLVGIATTMEQRRRDLTRLRDAITRMD
ncbi:hypothetical protein [Actinoplanes sp. NPDC051851]|uniref:SCO7613 C-terminal domain-containing membrane protein n=1 Tax=Actinoplanes sp. NPDC051851 TaxID=3154753 RepID=UPI003443EB78